MRYDQRLTVTERVRRVVDEPIRAAVRGAHRLGGRLVVHAPLTVRHTRCAHVNKL